MTYLIVGVNRRTLAQWHRHVLARDVGTATLIARARAAAQGVDLVIAAVVGPNSSVLPEPVVEPGWGAIHASRGSAAPGLRGNMAS